jgi:hypothetical protein
MPSMLYQTSAINLPLKQYERKMRIKFWPYDYQLLTAEFHLGIYQNISLIFLILIEQNCMKQNSEPFKQSSPFTSYEENEVL